jgi:Na+-transporting methylmalonyl-CoA/oxaloacetate decarboxylase gamma subunit
VTPELQTALSISVVGLVAVFSVLSLVALVVKLLGVIDARRDPAVEPQLAPPGERPPDQSIDDLTLVLISAACATVIQGRFRIRQVTRVPGARAGAWSQQGRAVLLGSHIFPKRGGSQ